MPKDSLVESRRGFAGGLNITAASDILNDDELLQCVNARVDQFGGVFRRPGSVKLNTTPLDDENITAVYQWMASPDTFTPQVIAVAGQTLWRCPAPYSVAFTGGATFSHGIPHHVQFALFRDSASATIKVFIAAHGALYKWDGTTLTLLTGTWSAPAANNVRVFGTRLFCDDVDDPKAAVWSKIGVGDDFRTGGIADGGRALVDLLGGPYVVNLEVVGSSLLISTTDSIARFTGTADDIRIAQDTQGVSAEVGPSSINGMMRMDQVAFAHNERGLYVVTEGGVLNVGKKIFSPSQIALRMTTNILSQSGNLLPPVVGHNPRRTEAWYAYVPVGGTKRTHVLVYNYSMQCWSGPFIYEFGINCFGTFENTDGIEQIMAGCDDGFIRLLDHPSATSFDDNVTDFDCVVQPAPFGSMNGPRTTKALRHVFLQVIGDHTFSVRATGDLGTTDDGAFVS